MSQTTTDHAKIKSWVEERGGVPATVESTAGRDAAGLLRIDFPDTSRDDELSTVAWDEFFKTFDENDLAFLYQEQTSSGKTSRFCKFVTRGS